MSGKAFQSVIRRPVRLQFGLRSVLLLVLVVALLLYDSERRATQQRELAHTIASWGGEYQRTLRWWVPLAWKDALGPERAAFISSVSLEASLWPTETGRGREPYGLVSSEELIRVLGLPAMDAVSSLTIYGSSVTDEVAPALLQLDNLQRLELTNCTITPLVQDQLRAKSGLVARIATVSMPQRLPGLPFWMNIEVDKLKCFAAARDGDPAGIRELFDLTGKIGVARFQTRLEPRSLPLLVLSAVDRLEGRAAVRQGLKHDSQDVRILTLRVLNEFGEFGHLQTTLEDTSELVRIECVAQISHSPEPLRLFQSALQDESARVRQAVVECLAAIGGAGSRELLLSVAEDPHKGVRWSVTEALGNLKDSHPSITEHLLTSLEDKEASIRSAAARHLGSRPLEHKNDEILRALRVAGRDNDGFVRRHAEASLSKLGQQVD